MEWIDAAIARRRRGEHISTATDTDATIADVVFFYAVCAKVI
jgi:hypothetical protein